MPNLDDKSLRLSRRKIHEKQDRWPVEKKIEAVTQWLALGNRKQVAAITGVGYETLRFWHRQDWWADFEAEIKASRRIQTNSKLSKIVDKALGAIEDRVENGDWVYDHKASELVRRPVSALTATKVANDLLQRQEALEKTSSAEVVHQQTQTIQDQLAMLANEFSKFNKGRTVDVVAREIPDALSTERETRLQAGSSAVYVEALSGEEAGGAEQSSIDDDEDWDGEEG